MTKASKYSSVFRPDLFAGQAVVVTGAGSGIGRAAAHELITLGARVALVGRKLEKLDAVRAEIELIGGVASCHTCDIREEDQVKAAFAQIMQAHGRIDGLLNNAGGQFPAPLETVSMRGWDSVVRNNLYGGFICSRVALDCWMRENGGAIVNMLADIWGGMPTMGHSGAARAGMLNLTETAACEWAQYGIRVNAVAPGWIASSGFDTYDPAMKAQLKRLEKVIPLQRYGTESEVASTMVFLLSPAANFITGSCIRIDGGVPNARHTWTPQPMRNPESLASSAFNGFHLASLPKMLTD